MPNLANPRPILTEFRATLPYRLPTVLGLLAIAPRVEGLAAQLCAARSNLAGELKRDIELLFAPLGTQIILTRLSIESPTFDNFGSFLGWFANTPLEDVRIAVTSLLEGLTCVAGPASSPSESSLKIPSLDDDEALRAFLLEVPDVWAAPLREDKKILDRMIRVLQDPAEALTRLVFVLTQFWEAYGRDLYDTCTPIIKRSMRYHEMQEYSGTAEEIYFAVTDKRPADKLTRLQLEQTRRLVFIPSCYCGARAYFMGPLGESQTVFVSFNARSAGANLSARYAEVIGHVFPPLKALADETRLQIITLLRGRELYAQEIVDQLELSQSSVSRHLSLMVASGILSVRRERGMNFYALNRPSMERLLKQLHGMTEEREDN